MERRSLGRRVCPAFTACWRLSCAKTRRTKRENSKLTLAESRNLVVGSRLLGLELVGRETNDLEALVVVLSVQLLEDFVLRSLPARLGNDEEEDEDEDENEGGEDEDEGLMSEKARRIGDER